MLTSLRWIMSAPLTLLRVLVPSRVTTRRDPSCGLANVLCGALFAVLAATAGPAMAQSVLYVRPAAAPAGDGRSWATAYQHPQQALAYCTANPGTRQVWIAAGNYTPDQTGTNPTRSFVAVANVTLLGGFAGTEAELWQRSPTGNVTILSGLYAGGTRAYHVVRSTSVTGVAFNRLTITKGQSLGDPADERGSGARITGGNVTFTQCDFIDNGNAAVALVNAPHGGAIAISGSATVTLTDCNFEGNGAGAGYSGPGGVPSIAGGHGGAISIESSTLTATRTSFSANLAGRGGSGECSAGVPSATTAAGNGGAIWASSATLTLNDCRFFGNRAGQPGLGRGCTVSARAHTPSGNGGAVATTLTQVTINRCTLIDNATQNGQSADCPLGVTRAASNAGDGGALHLVNSPANIYNSLLVGNRAGAGGLGITCGTTALPGTDGKGAGIFNSASTSSHAMQLVNCTIASNFNATAATPAGLAGAWRGVTTNSIFWNNNGPAAAQAGQIENPSAGALRHNTIQGWTGSLGGTLNNGSDPQFVDLDGLDNIPGNGDDNLNLVRLSPLIDSGRNTDVAAAAQSADLSGAPRFLENLGVANTGTGVAPYIDRGAFENAQCVADCDGDGLCDSAELLAGNDVDCNVNGIPDGCEPGGIAQINNPDPLAGEAFAFSVDVDRDWMVVGERYDDGFFAPPGDSGAAHMYQRVDGAWVYRQRLVASDAAIGDQLGNIVTIDGEWAMVAARYDDHTSLTDAGSVYVFRRQAGGLAATGGTWTQTQILRAADPAAGDEFGHGLSLDGGLAIVGSLNDDDRGSNSGSAYIYRLNTLSNTWALEQKLSASDGVADAGFGLSVSIQDSPAAGALARAVVGAFGDTQRGYFAGAAYIYARTAAGWTLEQKLIPDVSQAFYFMGEVVALDADILVVAARGDDNQSTIDAGAALVFERFGVFPASQWSLATKLVQGPPAGNFGFGFYSAVGDGGRLIAVGSPWKGDELGRPQTGGAEVFIRTPQNTWVRSGALNLTPPPPSAGAGQPTGYFGYALSISERNIISGAYAGVVGSIAGAGWLRSYSADALDCDGNGIPDSCDLVGQPQRDRNANGVLDPCERPACIADYNDDGGVDGADVAEFFEAWSAGEIRSDVNYDGGVDGADVGAFFNNWVAAAC